MKFKCKNPKCSVEFDSEEIKSMKIVEEDNQNEEYQVLFFECPECGQKVFVQIDSTESLQCLSRCKVQMAKIAMLKKKGKSPKRKLLADFKKEREYLHRCRTSLQERLTGKTVYNYAGESFVLRLDYEDSKM